MRGLTIAIVFRSGELVNLRDHVDRERGVVHPTLTAELPNGQWWMFLGPAGGDQRVSVLIGDELRVLRQRHPEYEHFPDSAVADNRIV